MPEKSHEFDPDVIRARVNSLKSGRHNAQTARITIWKIKEAVTKGYVTWEQLGVSEEQLVYILQQKIQAEGMELRASDNAQGKKSLEKKTLIRFQIDRFIKVWNEYSAGNQNVLLSLLFEFREIKQMLMEGEITPANLMPDFPPGEYFSLNELLEKHSP